LLLCYGKSKLVLDYIQMVIEQFCKNMLECGATELENESANQLIDKMNTISLFVTRDTAIVELEI